jgi:hypothetical protein
MLPVGNVRMECGMKWDDDKLVKCNGIGALKYRINIVLMG